MDHGIVIPPFGYIPSPEDTRDYKVDALYGLVGKPKPVAAALPSWFVVKYLNPVSNQGNTPMCVAYSLAGVKQWQDRADQTPTRWWDFSEPVFFKAIGGGPNGAVLRNGLNYLRKTGYPLVINQPVAPPNTGMIGGYYSVPASRYDLCAAISTFGPLVCGFDWPDSWSHPAIPKIGSPVAPRPSGQVNGHAIEAIGWNTVGLLLQNTWGIWPAPGKHGRIVIPWAYVASNMREAWKLKDAA